MRTLENIFAGLFFFGLIACVLYVIIGSFLHENIKNYLCEETCNPYKVMSCTDYDVKFFHPKYVDVIVVCAGEEMKAKHIIK